jgi:uncharacterized protein (DUF2062 family)
VTFTPPSPTVGLFRERVVAPFARLLAHGVTPRKLAECVAVGLMVGVFPALGVTTALAALASWMFRLNPIAIQLVNYLVYPLQFVLILPFFKAGQWLFGAEPLGLTLPQLAGFVKNEPLNAIKTLWTTTWHAGVVWLICAAVLIPILSLTLTPVFAKLIRTRSAAEAP